MNVAYLLVVIISHIVKIPFILFLLHLQKVQSCLRNRYNKVVLHCRYNLVLNTVVVEGGGAIRGSYIHIEATDLTVDDGGEIDVSNGGHPPNQGQSEKILPTMKILKCSSYEHVVQVDLKKF